ncbi:MAG: dihydroorotase [Vulcanisaeta sp. AZ3]|jgi:dihydroorotase|nr:MAG: dihydroorotase [Vulcanisaeta sp. AZ3]
MDIHVLIHGRAYVMGNVKETYIGITKNQITYVGNKPTKASYVIDLPNQYIILPGLTDIHVHLRDFEQSYKEDIESGTQAALAGGFVALGDMPNTKPPIKTIELLKRRIEEFNKRTNIHIRHYFGAPQDPSILAEAKDAGAYAVGEVLPEEVNEYGGDQYLDALFKEAARVGIPIIMHCEDPVILNQYNGPRDFKYHNEIRSPKAELTCIHNVIRLTYRHGTKVHITHITLPQSINLIKSTNLDITFDVTPHHILLSQEECLARADKPSHCKINPPLRDEATRKELLAMFLRGEIPIIASDHAPHAQWEKEKPYDEAPPGIPGLETTAPLLLTLWHKGLSTISTVVRAIQENPTKFLNLNIGIKPSSCADLTIINTKAKHTIDPTKFKTKAKYTPFKGLEVEVDIATTILHGKAAYINTNALPGNITETLEKTLTE